MFITSWLLTYLAFFNQQFSYDKAKEPLNTKYVDVVDGKLRLCLYEGDLPFKRGSSTLPRTELREKQERGEAGSQIMYFVNFTLPEDTGKNLANLSIWQVFGSGPEVMIRIRNGVKQVVVFGSKEKINIVEQLPNQCKITCGDKKGRGAMVECGSVKVEARIRCRGKMHLKIGPYAQSDDYEDVCIHYGSIETVDLS